MRVLLLVLAVAAALQCAFGQTPPPPAGEKLIFSDEFNAFDLSIWEHEITASGGGNYEFEYYLNNRTNSYVRDGVLYLKPSLTADTIGEANLKSGFTLDLWGNEPANLCTGNAFYGCSRTAGGGGNIINPIQSARLRTAQSFKFSYGHVEVRAKLPKGDWLWPAIWFLPRYNAYGNWPASGEIDMVESRGNDPSYAAGGCDTFGTTLHWGPYYGADKWPLTHKTYKLPSGTFNDDFHVFGMRWTEWGLYSWVDDETNVVLDVKFDQSFYDRGGFASSNAYNPWVGQGNAAPFDQEFYVIFDLAVGGTSNFFPDGVGNKPWSNSDPNSINAFWAAKSSWYPTWQGEDAALQIDYIRIYQNDTSYQTLL